MSKVDINQVMVAVALKKKLDAFIKDAKVALELDHKAGDAEAAVFDLDGQPIQLGKFLITNPKHEWKLVDTEALREWAEVNMPELGSMVFQLDKNAVASLMGEVKKRNGAFTDDGEVIPGIVWQHGSTPYARFTPEKDIDDVLRLIQSEGRLGELTGGVLGIEP
ncbi:MAG: hypothetical protein EOM43_17695 [Gammaproteobacteria bacterium]|nr:hypothetical protein [Gammaproteobacteria bacterium]